MDEKLVEEIKNSIVSGEKRINIYSPIYIKNELYFEFHKRPLNKQLEMRISLFPKNFKKESILDVGINSGFVALYLKKYHNAGRVLGIDTDKNFKTIWERTLSIENLPDLDFKMVPKNWTPEEKFDNILILSVSDKDAEWYDGLDFLLNKYAPYVDKSFYIEPTNHSGKNIRRPYTKEETKEIYIDYLSRWGNVEHLGYTDYQDRGLFRVDV